MRPYPGDEAFDAEVQARSEKLKASTREFLRLQNHTIEDHAHSSKSRGPGDTEDDSEVLS